MITTINSISRINSFQCPSINLNASSKVASKDVIEARCLPRNIGANYFTKNISGSKSQQLSFSGKLILSPRHLERCNEEIKNHPALKEVLSLELLSKLLGESRSPFPDERDHIVFHKNPLKSKDEFMELGYRDGNLFSMRQFEDWGDIEHNNSIAIYRNDRTLESFFEYGKFGGYHGPGNALDKITDYHEDGKTPKYATTFHHAFKAPFSDTTLECFDKAGVLEKKIDYHRTIWHSFQLTIENYKSDGTLSYKQETSG